MTIPSNALIGDQNQLLEQFFNAKQTGLWTALPAIVQEFDPETLTCVCQPTIKGRIKKPDGSIELVDMPLLLDCPVVFPHAGGCSMTFPVKQGDECLVVFASRGIDFWWQNGGVQPPPEPRMHDLSDGFAILGVWSQVTKIASVSTSSVQLRSDDGQAFVEINPQTHDINAKTSGNITATASGNATLKAQSVTIDAPSTTITGNLTVNGLISGKNGISSTGGSGVQVSGDVVADGISLKSHTHPCGDHNTGSPN